MIDPDILPPPHVNMCVSGHFCLVYKTVLPPMEEINIFNNVSVMKFFMHTQACIEVGN